MIDSLRDQIQQRIDELLGELERLRNALSALDPRTEKPRVGARKPAAAPSAANAKAGAPRTTAKAQRRRPATTRSTRRTASGATKSAVLGALTSGQALTAGEVAAKTGLGRGTVSTTLSKLAKSGEVQKAQRGYTRTRT